MKCGPDLICNLAAIVSDLTNLSMHGWMFEMWLFTCVQKGGLNVWDLSSGSKPEIGPNVKLYKME